MSSQDAAARARALSSDADACVRRGDLAAAETGYREALAIEPTARRWHNLATVLQLLGHHPQAEAGFGEALALDPANARARGSLGLSVLAQGRWAEGFPLYDAWRELPEAQGRAAPELVIPRWRGEPLAGKSLVVWGEEGFGDQIMFARFAKALEREGAEVGWVAHPALTRLLQEGLGQQAAAMRPGLSILGADFVVPSSQLPALMMARTPSPPPAPYLASPPANRIEGLRLGIKPRGSAAHDNDANRSLDEAAAAALLALPGAVSLAPEETGARDFWDTAGIIAGLDLVISVDTAVAHLAGALGRRCWVLLPAVGCDWRWGSEGETTPWYPSLRLFRQRTPGNWEPVIDEVRSALQARAG